MVRTRTTTTTTRVKQTPPAASTVTTISRTPRQRQRRRPSAPGVAKWVAESNPTAGLSLAGENFLKAAYAPPDFENIDFQGVPDEFNGKVTTVTQKLSTTFNVDQTGPDVLIPYRTVDVVLIQLPIPGVACLYGLVPAGQPVNIVNLVAPGFANTATIPSPAVAPLGPVIYTDTPQLFPGPVDTGLRLRQNFSSFRIVQNAIEARALDALLTVSGMVQVMKLNVSFTRDKTGDFSLVGFDGITAVSTKASYSGRYKDGFYTINKNNQPDWPFTPIVSQDDGRPTALIPIDMAGSGSSGVSFITGGGETSHYGVVPVANPDPNPGDAYAFLGMGTLEATVIRMSGLPTTTVTVTTPTPSTYLATKCSFNLRAWQTGEYAVMPNSLVYQFANSSPPEDKAALCAYRDVIDVLPTAVPAAQNDSFWTSLLRSLAAGFKALPGIALKFFTGNYAGMARDIVTNAAFTPRMLYNAVRNSGQNKPISTDTPAYRKMREALQQNNMLGDTQSQWSQNPW